MTDRSRETPFLPSAGPNPVDHGHYLKMSVRSDSSFTMTNERNGFTKNYPARGK